MSHHHVLLVSLPLQSHINPTFRLATRLTHAGARVTLATTVNGLKTLPSVPGLSYHFFSDGGAGKPNYLEEVKLHGSINLKELIVTKAQEGQKVDLLIYGLSIPWVAQVAREVHVPSALFFFQSAASFSVVYHFFKSDGGVGNSSFTPTSTVKLPGLPLLRYNEIPTHILPTQAYAHIFQQHIETLEKHPNSIVLINTFDGLEEECIQSLPDQMNIFSVGPLNSGETEEPFVRNTFYDSDRETYLRWLDSKPEKSVVYVSFGSLVKIQKNQNDEIYQGLIEFGHPFLWVIRGEDDEEMRHYAVEEGGGLIVRWCSQVEVLKHVAIGCFVTHCGWNSALESMVSGVGMVGCPQNADQMMNGKMMEEVWGNGVKAVANSEGVVGREEMKRCLEVVMGLGGGEIKRNCERLKSMAMEAGEEGGSSHTNLNRFFQTLKPVSE